MRVLVIQAKTKEANRDQFNNLLSRLRIYAFNYKQCQTDLAMIFCSIINSV